MMLYHACYQLRASSELQQFHQRRITYCFAKSEKQEKTGSDELPPEFWQLCACSHKMFAWLLQFSDTVWHTCSIPSSWHEARVACIFKKVEPKCPENYRPISLLPVAYKLFGASILNRLKSAGAEKKLWRTQFGFRSKHGTQAGIFIIRRFLEQCHNSKDNAMILLALDWAKAFVSIDPADLIQSLHRFGLPSHLLKVIEAIYCKRCFHVMNRGYKSRNHA